MTWCGLAYPLSFEEYEKQTQYKWVAFPFSSCQVILIDSYVLAHSSCVINSKVSVSELPGPGMCLREEMFSVPSWLPEIR